MLQPDNYTLVVSTTCGKNDTIYKQGEAGRLALVKSHCYKPNIILMKNMYHEVRLLYLTLNG